MSNYHVREIILPGKLVNVVFHIPVPSSGTNQASLTWREAVVESAGGSVNISSVLPSLAGSQEETDMKAGAVIELSAPVRFSKLGLSSAEMKAEIEAAYSETSASLISQKQEELAFMGFSADVA